VASRGTLANDTFPVAVHAEELVSRAQDARDARADRTQAAFKKVNNELKRLKSQFSNVKRENEILRQVKDTLSKRLQSEEQKNAQLVRDTQRSRKESTSTSQHESEIRELRTKLAIAEAEREAAQSLANVRVRHEKMFFLSEEEKVQLCYRWVILYWYWSVAEKLSIFPEVASVHATQWGKMLRSVPSMSSSALLLSDVADLLEYPSQREGRKPGKDARAGGSGDQEADDPIEVGRNFTLHDLVHAETSLRSLYEMEVDNRVHSQLMQRTRAQILPAIRDLANPLSSVTIDTLSLDSSLDNDLTFTYDFVTWIQLSRLWLGYIWGKALDKNIEPHIAESRRDMWRERAQGQMTSRDLVDVQKAMQELHALQVETQLWVSRSKVVVD